MVAITFWYEKHRNVSRGSSSHFVPFALTFRSFLLFLIAFTPMVCLNDASFRKAMICVAFNPYLNVLLIFNMCHYWLIIYLIFGIVGLLCYRNGIMFFHTALVLINRADLSSLSTFLILLQMMFLFYLFYTNRLIKSFESLEVEQAPFIFNASL